MSLNPVYFDDSTGRYKRVTNASTGFTDYFFTVGGGGQTSFVISGGTVTALGKIDVWRNGIQELEGVSDDWQRNTGTNAVVFNSTVPQNAKIRVRLYT